VKMIRSGESGAKRGLPAIMLTSNSDPAVIRLALLLDVSGFLVKPVSAKKITERLNTALVHPIDLKGPEYYLKLDLSKMYANEEDKTHAVSQKNMSRNSKNSGKKGVTRLDDVVAGMTLSSDLHGENQQMIQAAGTALTPDVLSLLLQI
jgi:DNA-binding NarL/FixJ family response regulator